MCEDISKAKLKVPDLQKPQIETLEQVLGVTADYIKSTSKQFAELICCIHKKMKQAFEERIEHVLQTHRRF